MAKSKKKKKGNQHFNRVNAKKRLKVIYKTQELISRLIKESKIQKS